MSQADNDEATLVLKLPLGNPEGEALASQDGKQALPAPNSPARAWELAKIPPNPPFSKGGDGGAFSTTTIDSTSAGSSNAGENHGRQKPTNPAPSFENSETSFFEKPEKPIPLFDNPATAVPPFEKGGLGEINQNPNPPFENPATPVPPFEKGGLGGINQNPNLATGKIEAGQ